MMIVGCILLGLLLILAFLFYASYSIQQGIYLRSLCQKRTTDKVVSLTFDDGPHPVETPKVLQTLKEHQVSACFFCIGRNIAGNEALIRQMISEGHLVGNHSYSHSNFFPFYSLSKMTEDLRACQSLLEQVTSQPVVLFRPPFGVTNPTIAKAVFRLGYTSIGWNIRTLDTKQPEAEKILLRIRKQLKPGSIILLHDRMPGSAKLLEQILALLKEQGYRVVSL